MWSVPGLVGRKIPPPKVKKTASISESKLMLSEKNLEEHSATMTTSSFTFPLTLRLGERASDTAWTCSMRARSPSEMGSSPLSQCFQPLVYRRIAV